MSLNIKIIRIKSNLVIFSKRMSFKRLRSTQFLNKLGIILQIKIRKCIKQTLFKIT